MGASAKWEHQAKIHLPSWHGAQPLFANVCANGSAAQCRVCLCVSPRIAAELLRLLCPDGQVREQVKVYEGVPVLLSLLHSEHLKLLWSVVWVLVQLCEDPDTSAEVRAWGGVQQLLRILDW